MTDLLERAFDEASKLPPADQDAFAEWILDQLSQMRGQPGGNQQMSFGDLLGPAQGDYPTG